MEIREAHITDYYMNPIAYVRRGIYIDQIQRYFDCSPREQILIIGSGELKRNSA